MKITSSLALNVLRAAGVVLLSVLSTLFLPAKLQAQEGFQSNVVWRAGMGISGVNVAVCQPLATTAASVSSNLATLTMSSNPITAGYAQGMTILISGFTGGDTYFNAGTLTSLGQGTSPTIATITGGFTILSVTPSQIIFTLVHANTIATSNGTVLQQGNSITSCAGKASIYKDGGGITPATNPTVSDGYGNYSFWAPPGNYYLQYYGPTVTTSLTFTTVAGTGSGSGGITCAPTEVLFGSGVTTATCDPNFSWDNTNKIVNVGPAGNPSVQLLSTNPNDGITGLLNVGPPPYATSFNYLYGNSINLTTGGEGAAATLPDNTKLYTSNCTSTNGSECDGISLGVATSATSGQNTNSAYGQANAISVSSTSTNLTNGIATTITGVPSCSGTSCSALGDTESPSCSGAPCTAVGANYGNICAGNGCLSAGIQLGGSCTGTPCFNYAIQLTTGSIALGGGSDEGIAGEFLQSQGPGAAPIWSLPTLSTYLDVTKTAAPSDPASGVDRLYADSTSGLLVCLTSVGGSCMPTGSGATLQTNSSNNTNQALLNIETSTANSVGLTITPSNPSGGIEKWEITGSSYTGNAATATSATSATTATSATSAGKWTTARNLAGNSVDGSANVAFANAFIVQGTADAGLTGAQFLGALATGLLKNTTTTGVLSAAASSDVYALFSGTCNSTTYLSGSGACSTPSGSGVSIQTNTTPNASQTVLNFKTSTANAVGLTVTPAYSATGNEELEVTGSTYTGTATNLSGTPALPNGTTATTQTVGDNTTKLATDAFVLANTAGGGTLTDIGASLPAGQLVLGNTYPDTVKLGSLGTTVTVLHGNAAGAPTWAVITPADAVGNVSGTGNFCLVTSCTMVTPALGTPSAIVLTNATGAPTWNQNTTGSAATWTTARNLAGNSVNGSANVAFSNKFIVQGTADAGLSGAQFLGALGTGILKNTTTTGVLSIANSADILGSCTSCTQTIVSGIASMGTSLITSGTCAAAVTVSAPGVATTDTIQSTFNGDPTGVVGYMPSTNGMLTIIAYPTSGNVNYKVCNNTGSGITPGAITINFRVVR